MGSRGPVGKRSSERMGHRTKAEKALTTGVRVVGVVTPPAASRGWHPAAKAWYDALKKSGQAVFFEPSDWAQARYVAEAMTRSLNADRFEAALFKAVLSGMDGLLTSEASRRRVRAEIDRVASEPAEVTSLADYKDSLAQG